MRFPFEFDTGLTRLKLHRDELAEALADAEPSSYLQYAWLSPLLVALGSKLGSAEESLQDAGKNLIETADRVINSLEASGPMGMAVLNGKDENGKAWRETANYLGRAMVDAANDLREGSGIVDWAHRVWIDVVKPTYDELGAKADDLLHTGEGVMQWLVVGLIAVAIIFVVKAAR